MLTTPPAPATPSRLGLLVLALLGLTTWALSHSYVGIFHDAGLYTLQALAHLRPETLSADVFLKFGSQDRFTIFSPLYASAGRLLGVESAAALLTLLFQIALLLGAWVLARAVMPFSMALLGLAVLLAIPGDYGADRIFTCIEPFLTPRMAAEALVLAGLAAALSEVKPLAVALVITAALFHPIMAMAGVSALYCLYLGARRPNMATALAIVGLTALALAAFAMPRGPWGRFDPEWLTLVEDRSPYLFLAHWQLDDWSRAAVSAATLLTGIGVLPNPAARTLSKIAMVTGLSGTALTLLACDLLHLVLFTQLQPWRWQWLATVVAALLLPEIVRILWGRSTSGRTTGLLLLAAWIFASNPYALAAAVAALMSQGFLHRFKPSEARWVLLGAFGMLGLACAWRLASNLEFTDAHYFDPTIPLWIRRTMSFAHDGAAPVAIIALAWWLARSRRGQPGLMVLAVLASAGCAALLPQTLRSWTAREFTSQHVAQFADLRQHIPPRSEVFWPESPVAVWMLLDRPSYLSVIQTSGMVFSRGSARELKRRAEALKFAVNPSSFMHWSSAGTGMTLSQQQLQNACGTGEFEFLVTSADLGTDPVATIPAASAADSKKIRLYRCKAGAG
jgi:hypothetical protein